MGDPVLDLLEGPKRAAPSPRPAAAAAPAPDAYQVPPAVQAARDDSRVQILRAELARTDDPNDRAMIEREISLTTGGRASPRSGPTPVRVAAQEAPAPDPVLALLEGSGAAPRAPVRVAPTRGEVLAEPGMVDRAKDYIVDTAKESLRDPTGMLRTGEVLGNQVTGIGHAILGGWRGLTALASGAGLDEAVRQVEKPELAGGASAETYQPETAGGKAGAALAALPGEAIAGAGRLVGEAVYEGSPAGRVIDPLGLGKGSAAAGAIAETAVNAAPLALIRTRGAAAQRPVFGERTVGSGTIAEQPAGAPAAAVEATTMANLDIPTYLRRKAAGEPQAAPAQAAAPRQPLTLEPQPPRAAKGPSVFDEPGTTPQQAAAAAEAQAPKFTEAPVEAAAGSRLPKADIASREAVLREVGIKNARRSAVEGNPAEARVDFDASRTVGHVGDEARAKLGAERTALEGYAERLVADTGGTAGLDTNALYGRGNSIATPFQGLKTWFDANTKKLYTEADTRAKGAPVELRGTRAVLGEESAFAGSQEGTALRKGIDARMRELKMVDKKGKPLPATIEQVERLRQYVGDQWSPRTSRLVGRIKDVLDDDVTRTAGEDIYAKARAMRAMRSTVFENDVLDPNGRVIPNGVGKLFDASGKALEPLKATEQIPDALARLPVDELAQVVKTLKNMPPELQPQAKAALAEIKGQFANRIAEAGGKTKEQWSAAGVSKYLNANSARLRLLFDDAELKRISNLNDAGHILHIGPYPGAAVQGTNLVRAGVAKGIEAAGSGIGAVVGTVFGGPIGTAVGTAGGGMVGRAVAGKLGDAAALKQYRGRYYSLADVGKGAP